MKKIAVAKSGVAGVGAYALKPIKKGELVLHMTGTKLSSSEADAYASKHEIRNDDWFQVGEDMYVLLDTLPNAINHSCSPNLGISGLGKATALRDIRAGEELFYDYSTTVGLGAPGEGAWRLRCRCGAKYCRKSIGDWETIPRARLVAYKRKGALLTYIQKQMARR